MSVFRPSQPYRPRARLRFITGPAARATCTSPGRGSTSTRPVRLRGTENRHKRLRITLQLQDAIRHVAPPLQTAGEAATIQARAYVSVSDAGVSDPIGDTPPTVFVSIKNTGQTPAYDLTWRAIFTIRDFPVSGEFLMDRQKDAPKSVLPPGQSLFYQWTFTDWVVNSAVASRNRTRSRANSSSSGDHIDSFARSASHLATFAETRSTFSSICFVRHLA